MLKFSRLINFAVYALVLEAMIEFGVCVISSSSEELCDVVSDITWCEHPFLFSSSVLVSFSVFHLRISCNHPRPLVVYCIGCISDRYTVAFDSLYLVNYKNNSS